MSFHCLCLNVNIAHQVQQENLKPQEEALGDFSVENCTTRSRHVLSLIIVCCCLLLCILTAISIVAFTNNRNILSLPCPFYANSTIRPAETGSLEWVVQKQQHFKVLVPCQQYQGIICAEREVLSLSVSVRALQMLCWAVLRSPVDSLQIFLLVSVL